MKQVVIENPVINGPFREPNRHFRFSSDGITNEIVEGRRVSSYFSPIPKAKKKSQAGQLALSADLAPERIEENKFINDVRRRVGLWRKGGYTGITKTSALLLQHWRSQKRDRALFFCQIEALETVIYVTEVAGKFGDGWIEAHLRSVNEDANPGLFRLAFKMATGTGKTVVMAMLIAWQTLNKVATPQDSRFNDAFLLVTPGITIRDRLRVLLPADPQNYYRKMEIIPPGLMQELHKAKVVIVNYHNFGLRENTPVGKLTRDILGRGKPNPFVETPGEMVRRVCRELGTRRNIIVINDEAHHCYRRKPDGQREKLEAEDRQDAERREAAARRWISGLEAIKAKLGIKAVYDLSATPFFLRGSGYPEGTLFPWVVSDFSLIDAIESGIVKVPRVPVSDDSVTGELPMYRDLWPRIREHLPKKGRNSGESQVKFPAKLETAIESLYLNYKAYYQQWDRNYDARAKGLTPPVFIVVCANTFISKMVYDYIAGYEKPLPDGSSVIVEGKLELFRNSEGGRWLPRPNTILVDSEQLESGEGMTEEFKRYASREIEEFKEEYRARFPGREADDLTDEDLLREVMNTVGKPGKLGEGVRCVVSVSMLTEGWDAQTVTHILGVRAFGTQLLCEQVVGRALRRMSYVTNAEDRFDPEYAEVFGVPFSFIPCSGSTTQPAAGPVPTRVRSLEDRKDRAIYFPRVVGYRYELPMERVTAKFTQASFMSLTTQTLAINTENAGIVGEAVNISLEDKRQERIQTVEFDLARRVLRNCCSEDEAALRPWLFPQLLGITRAWLRKYLVCKDNTFPQLLLYGETGDVAAARIFDAIMREFAGEERIRPTLRSFEALGSTHDVDFNTIKDVYATRPDKCHISHVVADTQSFEQKMAEVLETMPEVFAYVKNERLGFTIPYVFNGEEHQYHPDFIARVDDGQGPDNLLNLIIEVSNPEDQTLKQQKVATAQTQWVPAINQHGGFGRWDFIEIREPWDGASRIRQHLSDNPLVEWEAVS